MSLNQDLIQGIRDERKWIERNRCAMFQQIHGNPPAPAAADDMGDTFFEPVTITHTSAEQSRSSSPLIAAALGAILTATGGSGALLGAHALGLMTQNTTTNTTTNTAKPPDPELFDVILEIDAEGALTPLEIVPRR